MKSLKFLVPLIATAAMASAAVPAKASIVFNTGASGTGNNVLFHTITGSGTSHLTSDTSQGENVTFTSTTDTLSSPSSGQARLVAGDGSLGEVMWYLTDLTKGFTTGVFNIDTPRRGGATSVTIYADDQHGEFSDTFSLTGNGQHFFTITANGGDIIKSLRIVMTGGDVDAVKQVRIDGIESIAAVPEPSTWAMMLIGFAGLGFAGYKRVRRHTIAA